MPNGKRRQEGDLVLEAPGACGGGGGGERLCFSWGWRSAVLSRDTPLGILPSHLPTARGPSSLPPPPPSAITVVTGSWLSPSPCQPRQPGAEDGGREPRRAQLARLPVPLSAPPSLTASAGKATTRRSPSTSLHAAGVSVPEADRRRGQPLGHDSCCRRRGCHCQTV